MGNFTTNKPSTVVRCKSSLGFWHRVAVVPKRDVAISPDRMAALKTAYPRTEWPKLGRVADGRVMLRPTQHWKKMKLELFTNADQRSGAIEFSGLIVAYCLGNFRFRVHHERSLRYNGLADRIGMAEQQRSLTLRFD